MFKYRNLDTLCSVFVICYMVFGFNLLVNLNSSGPFFTYGNDVNDSFYCLLHILNCYKFLS